MRVLVTGGAGFIGSHVTEILLANGCEVSVLDNFRGGYRHNLMPGIKTLYELDITDHGYTAKLPHEGFDVVCHFAAQNGSETSFADPVYDLRANGVGSLELLGWCLANQVRHFLFSSSMCVYGNPSNPIATEDETPLSPLSFYAVGKLAVENYMRIYNGLGGPPGLGLGTTAFRLFNTYGTRQDLTNMRQGMVSIYLAYVVRKEPLLVKGSLDRFRDFVNVKDVARAYWAAIRSRVSHGKVYNVGSGRKVTVREVVREILIACGEDPSEYPRILGDPTPFDSNGCYADIAKIRRDLGWEPEISLQDGLREMADWAKKQGSVRR